MMNRRDFLLFRTAGSEKTVELSCERLYMHYRDAQIGELPPDPDGSTTANHPRGSDGNPAPAVRGLASDLAHADVLRVTHAEWLAAADDFRHEVERLAAAVRARGGRVEFE